MIVPMRFLILCLCGNVLVSAIKSFRADELSLIGKLRVDGHPVPKVHDDLKASSSIDSKEEPLWVPWWVPQVSTHFTFFRAVMAALFASFVFASAAFLTSYTPSKFCQKCVCQAKSFWQKAPSTPSEPAVPALPAIPESPNVDDLDSELLERASFAEAIAKKQVAAFFDATAKDAIKRKKKHPVKREDLMSSDDEDVEDPDPPLRPGAEAPFTLLFGAECAEGAKSQEHVPFAFLMADDNPRPAVDTIRAPMVVSDLKTTISTKKFRHSLVKKSKMDGEKKGLSSSSSS